MIEYTKGYKYQLYQKAVYLSKIRLPEGIMTDFIDIYNDGEIVISKSYAWDGPSGPALDTKTFMRASLFHDALYQLMRLGLLGQRYRHQVDEMMKAICLEDGMSRFRASYTYWAVRRYANKAADPNNLKLVITAP